MMTDRVKRLRDESLASRPSISTERAEIITEFYGRHRGFMSEPVRRALAFKYLLEHKTIYIGDGELIVGEKGPAPKATPTYPELCCHSLDDLDILHSREKIPFAVSEEARRVYEKIVIPFWSGNSMRDLLFREMSDDWKAAYEAGIFTEFMEQRSPGHTVLDDKIYRAGMLDFQKEIERSFTSLDYLADASAYAKEQELFAMHLASSALVSFAERHAARARELAAREADPARRSELERIAEVCSRVPARAPRDFHEAIQYYWFVHLGVTIELNTWDSFSPGHLDRHLEPFYRAGIEDGSLGRERAEELLHCLWIKFNNQPAPPKVGVTAEESGTYTDFALINVGGLKEDGTDGVNELSFLILDVIEEMRILQPSSMVQISAKGPDAFLLRALKIVKTGFGQPSIFNTDAIVQELVRQGKSVVDARNGGASGCVEAGAFGKEAYILTGYFNLPKVFEITLGNGVDPRTGKRIGLETGDPDSFATFDELFEAFRKQIRHFVDIKVRGSNVIERLYAAYLPAPFLSVLVDDCVKTGRDYHAGGARYNTNYIQGVGVGTITDTLSAIRYNVYDHKHFGMAELRAALAADFEGHDALRQRVLNRTPKFGNDDDYADSLMTRVFEAYFEAVDGRPTPRGGAYRINLLPTTAHIYFGKMTGATADGRRAGDAVSEGVSPVQGADRKGPTAVVKSLGKMDHVRTGGTLLNQKFTPQLLAGETGLNGLKDLVRSYFRLMGHHIQFNVVTADLLRTAQAQPEKYRDLIVRVAGYSDYFVDCSTELQNEIIHRTEHQEL